MSNTPKRLWITGGSSGIGRALALHYAAPGVFLALTGRNSDRLAEVAALCEKKGATIETAILDVTSQQDMTAYGKKLMESGPLDLVIANAGISGGTGGNPDGEPLAQVRKIFDVNLYGVLNTVKAVLPAMLQAGSGQIALMSSLASFSGWPGSPAYSASKGAVRLYGEALRGSLSHTNIQVSVLCPGFIRTPMTDVNDYTMPFMLSAERSAAIMAAGLAKNKARIAFPWPTYLLAGFAGLLPGWLGVTLLSKFPTKPMQ
jgi:short-subunit dehydrogenase